MYQIVHMHKNICWYTHAVETSFYSIVFVHYSKQVSATYAQQTYLHGTEKKKCSYKKELTEKETSRKYITVKKVARKIFFYSFYSAYILIEVLTISIEVFGQVAHVIGQLAHVVSFWMVVF